MHVHHHPTPIKPARPPVAAIEVAFRVPKLPTGVTGLAGADVKTTASRYESTITLSGGLTGQFKGSVYPDNMNVKGRIKDGTYDLSLGFHKPGVATKHDLVVRTNGFRAVLVVNGSGSVPVTSLLATKTTADGVHVHNGYNGWHAAKPMSEGCLMLLPSDWHAFLTKFLTAFPDLADWTGGTHGGRVGRKIGKLTVSTVILGDFPRRAGFSNMG